MAATRFLEWLFVVYLVANITAIFLFDGPHLLPGFYPHQWISAFTWYTATFKDPLVADPPAWFMAFLYEEVFLHLPFFPVAIYAFWKGNCRWIRMPAILYATHMSTSVSFMVAHFLFADFSKSQAPGPETLRERLSVVSFYMPFLLFSLLILFTMLLSPAYNQVEKKKKI